MLKRYLSIGRAIVAMLKTRFMYFVAITALTGVCAASAPAQQPCDIGECPFLATCNFSGTWQGFATFDLKQSGAIITGTENGKAQVTGDLLDVFNPSPDAGPPTIELQVGSFRAEFGIADCNHFVEGEDSLGHQGLTLTKVASCDLGLPGSIQVFPGPPVSRGDGRPTSMRALFRPTSESPLGLVVPGTLADAAQACGYTEFNFQQVATAFPGSLGRFGVNPPFIDPPQGHGDGFPFYYSSAELTQLSCGVPTTTVSSLFFCDAPVDSLLGFPGLGNSMDFETRLVGISLLVPDGFDILYTWKWTSDYNTFDGGVSLKNTSGKSGVGSGGVTLTSLNGTPISTFSDFSNDLKAEHLRFRLYSHFVLGKTTDGIKPLTEVVALNIGSYSFEIPANSFKETKRGRYIYKGTMNDESLHIRIVAHRDNSYTLRAEGTSASVITLDKPAFVALRIGNDAGASAAFLRKEGECEDKDGDEDW